MSSSFPNTELIGVLNRQILRFPLVDDLELLITVENTGGQIAL